MGFIPPPRVLSFEEWEKAKGRDIRLEKWARYSNNPFGFILRIIDLFNKEKKRGKT